MDVRDAVEADAEELAELTDSPRDVMRNLVHDRTVRVVDAETNADADGTDGAETDAEADGTDDAGTDGVKDSDDAGADAQDSGDESENGRQPIRGFVSYDAREDTVHVTQLEGDGEVCDRLLEEPVRFAQREAMDVELLVPEDETGTCEAAEAAGFERAGSGPTFEGKPTIRFRLDPR